MPSKRYRVRLSETEREELKKIVKKSLVAKHKRLHAQILLRADEESEAGGKWKDSEIAEGLDSSESTVQRVREVFVEEGMAAALERRKSSRHYERKLDGKGEAILIAQACGPAPEGRPRWTLELLANRLVELKVTPSISGQTVSRTLKKTNSNPGSKSNGV